MEADRKGKFTYLDGSNNPVYLLSREWTNDNSKSLFESEIKDTFEDEIADATIRIFDLAFKMGFNLKAHILAKMIYNSTREIMHKGKKY